MTCSRCGRSFTLDNTFERCSLSEDAICPRCTLTDPSLHRCDMMCQARLVKFINHHPLTDGFAGFGSMTQVTTTTEEFMPSIYRFIYAKVSSVTVTHVEMNTLHVVVKMRLNGNSELVNQAYVREGWKAMHLLKALEESEIADISHPAPLLIFRPSQWLRIAPETLRVYVEGDEVPSTLSDRHELVGTPISDPPPSSHRYGDEIEPRGTYSYYGGKLSAIYGPLELDRDYTIEYEIEAVNPIYAIDFLFPFRYVDLEKITVNNTNQGVRTAAPVYGVFEPAIASTLTKEYEYKLNRPDGEFPDFEKATPFRDSPSLSGTSEDELELIPIDINVSYPIELDDYRMVTTRFQFVFAPQLLPYELIVQAKVTKRAIPIRTYEQMQRLPEYRDFLITFDLFNANDQKDRMLEVQTEIAGYTERVSQRVLVPRLGSEKPARIVINQCPPLKVGILEAMSGPVETELTYKVFEVIDEMRTLVASGARPVSLLSNEQIIWSLRDVTSGASYNLEPTLASWINPHDENGLLNQVREDALAFHPNGKLRGNKDGRATLAEQTSDIKALYDCLNQKYHISYGKHPFVYGFQYSDPLAAQRSLTAEQVLNTKTGVCIDFVILFASLMEGLAINPLLIISEDHAFLGWGEYKDKEKTIDDLGFLETTALGGRNKDGSLITFEVAQNSGREYFRKNFMFSNDSSVIMGLQTRMGKVVVDLADARKEGSIAKE